MKKIEVIVRTTEDNFPPQEKVVLKFTEQTVSSAENDAVLSYPGLEIHLEHHRVFKNGQEVYMFNGTASGTMVHKRADI